MTANALLVALTLTALSATAIGYLIHRQSVYRRSVADALTRGEIAREELARLQSELQTVNQQLLATSGREEGLKATLALKDNQQVEKTALLEEAKKALRLEFEKTAQTLVSKVSERCPHVIRNRLISYLSLFRRRSTVFKAELTKFIPT